MATSQFGEEMEAIEALDGVDKVQEALIEGVAYCAYFEPTESAYNRVLVSILKSDKWAVVSMYEQYAHITYSRQ